MINQIVTRYWRRSVARSVLVGDGAGQNLLGITAKSGVASIDASTGTKTAAVLAAVAAVQGGDGGWEGPHTVVGNPADLEVLFGETEYRADRFPTVARWVPFSRIPAGTVFVGAQRAANLHTTGLTVEISDDHVDNWTKGVVTIQPSAHLWLDIPFPGAFAKVINF